MTFKDQRSKSNPKNFEVKYLENSTRMWTGADPGIYFGGPYQGPQAKVKGEARIEGEKRPSIEGEAWVEGAKRPRIEGEARTEGEAREKAGGGVWGGGSVSPSPEILIFWKIKLETIHFGGHWWLPARGAPCTCPGIHLPDKTKCHLHSEALL